MYAYIKGKLILKNLDNIIVDNNNIGYKISMATSAIEKLDKVGSDVIIYTHLHVREDDMSLFGFESSEQLNMFEMLLTVSGVGPKVALAILSAISPSKFSLAVLTNDAKALSKAPGVGNKVAQRIILELKEKVEKSHQLQLDKGAEFSESVVDVSQQDESSYFKFNEAVSALTVLGYSVEQSKDLISSIYDESLDTEQLIMNALKGLGR